MKRILDVCCGSKMFWFNKNCNDTVFMDNRELRTTLCDGRELVVSPDIIGDFRNIPFPDESFSLVVFDPPHLIRYGKKSWLFQKYGGLESTWEEDLRKGFQECFRVLIPSGILIFKWNEQQIKLSEILKLCDIEPLFGNKTSKNTHWIVFMKKQEVGLEK